MKTRSLFIIFVLIISFILNACGGKSSIGNILGDTTDVTNNTSTNTGTGEQNTLPPKPKNGEFWYADIISSNWRNPTDVIGFFLLYAGDTLETITPNIANIYLFIDGEAHDILSLNPQPPRLSGEDTVYQYIFDREYIENATYKVELELDGVKIISQTMTLTAGASNTVTIVSSAEPAFAFSTEGDGIVFRITTPNLQDILSSDVDCSWTIHFELGGEQWSAQVSKYGNRRFVGPANTGLEDREVPIVFTEQNDMYIVFPAYGDISGITMISYPLANGSNKEINFNKAEMHIPLSQIITPADPNEYGNTIGNIHNGSFAVLKGNTVYYAHFYSGMNNGFYRVNTDGTGNIKITDNELTGNLNAPFQIVGDWIYFSGDVPSGNYGFTRSGIHRIRTDGTNLMTVYEINNEFNDIGNFIVVGDWIYFNEALSGGNYGIYKIRTIGIEKTLVVADSSIMQIDGDWIYYVTWGGLHKMRIDGTEKTRMDMGVFGQVVGDYVYYQWIEVLGGGEYPMGVRRVRLDNTGNEDIITDRVGGFNVVGDWIYYTNLSENYALYRIRTDGTGNERLNNSIMHGGVIVLGDWIYTMRMVKCPDGVYVDITSVPPILHKIRIDGTDFQVVD